MKILSIECNMGAAGDMLAAALFELLSSEEKDLFLAEFHALSLPGIRLEPVAAHKCGVFGTHMNVFYHNEEEDLPFSNHEHTHEHTSSLDHEHTHENHISHDHKHTHENHISHDHKHTHDSKQTHHQHYSYLEMLDILTHLSLPAKTLHDAAAIFERIAIAESQIHQTAIDQIHFHEIGTMDAVADVVACSMLFSMLAVEKIYCSPIHTGFGFVRCAHGILPVPAPATAILLKGIPIVAGNIEGELCTPTGAALLSHFVDEFSSLPEMTIETIGYGMGKKDFPAANCVRTFLGTTQSHSSSITKLECNVDDMIGEDLGYAMEQLFLAGALDVFFTSVQMKKNRPGHLITCLCKNEDKDSFINLLFLHTTTRGIRIHETQRAVMTASMDTLETTDGTVHLKHNSYENILRSKLEYEDLKEIALRNGEPLSKVRNRLLHTL